MTKLRVLGGIGLSGLVLLLSVFPILAQTRPATAPAQPAAKPFESAIQSLRFREIGPATMGGRVHDIEVPIEEP